MRRHPQCLAQQTIDPHSHDEAAFVGFDVNVRNALPHCFGNDAVDQTNGRRVIGRVEQIVGAWYASREHVEIVGSERHCGGGTVHLVTVRQQTVELSGVGGRDIERLRHKTPHLDQYLRVAAFPERYGWPTVLAMLQHHPELAGKAIRQVRRQRLNLGQLTCACLGGVRRGVSHCCAVFRG